MDDEITKQGMNARAGGLTEFDNPFYKMEAMPRQTGEKVEVWADKAERWALGWKLENAVR
ncbi:MAG TPA: CrpP-related protein [Sphingomonas sp.]|jgi:hypothetical protein